MLPLMIREFRFLLFLIALLGLPKARSAELMQPFRPISAMGMGGVYIPFPDAHDAVIVNPSALKWVSGIHLDAAEIGLGVNNDAISLYDELQNISQPQDYEILFGRPIWLGVSGKASLALPYFGAAGYLSAFASTTLDNPAYPDLNVTYIKDQVMTAGFALPIAPLTSLGVSLKQINRLGGNEDISLGILANGADLDGILDQFQDQGVGYGLDLALMTRIEAPFFQPTLTMVWHDVGFTNFSRTAGSAAPDVQRDNLIFGAGGLLDLPGLDLRAGIEYRHITLGGEPLGKKVHVGAELSLPLIDLRIGANQGYTTYGVGIDLFLMRLDVAMTTEELGVYPGQDPQKRYMAGLSMSLSFDPDFNFEFTDGKGRPRELKQRR